MLDHRKNTGNGQAVNYIGSKYSLLDTIATVISEQLPARGRALDLFSGTSTVAQLLKQMGYQTYANDWQRYAYVTARAYLDFEDYPSFARLLGSETIRPLATASMTTLHSAVRRGQSAESNAAFRVLRHLENLAGCSGSFFEHYCDGGAAGRMYFSQANGRRIQAIGDQISDWQQRELITPAEHCWLRASLIESADKVANTASIYGAYLKHVKATAQKNLGMIALAPVPSPHPELQHQAFCSDARTVCVDNDLPRMTLTYIDPPYNHRQYSSNYHILETLACWDMDQFEPRGKTGLRPASHQSSPFCSKVQAAQAFDQLFAVLRSDYLLFSYSSDGILSEQQLQTLFDAHCTEVQFLKVDYGRFRADNDGENRVYAADRVDEYLIFGKQRMLDEQ